MEHSNEINELAISLAKFQTKSNRVSKDAWNPIHGAKYADLASIMAVIQPELGQEGLAFSCLIEDIERSDRGILVPVTGLLIHVSGQWIKSTVSLFVPYQTSKKSGELILGDAQMIGSAVTYCRRYLMSAMLGIAAGDDDGNSISVDQEPTVNLNQPEPEPETETPKPKKSKIQTILASSLPQNEKEAEIMAVMEETQDTAFFAFRNYVEDMTLKGKMGFSQQFRDYLEIQSDIRKRGPQ